MTPEFQYLMHLAAAGARGETALSPDTGLDWQRLERLAKEQTVQHIAAYALKCSPSIPCPAELRQRMTGSMRNAAISNMLLRHKIMHLLQEMTAAGFAPVLMKGYAIADYCAAPECRPSSDADILVPPEMERKACDFLLGKGFSIKYRWKGGHHSECDHPEMGHVELHVLLYDELIEEVWFNKMDGREFIAEPPLHINSSDGPYATLGLTDHLIFLVMHMIKHFIQTGNSLRMMLDIALYFSKNKDSLDTARLWNAVNSLKYGELLNCILWAMVRYCGFRKSDFPGIADVPPQSLELILDDLEQGGWLGFNDKRAREDGWREYNRQLLLRNKSPLQYKLYMLIWQWINLATIFPDIRIMESHSPYLKKYPWLLPVAWMQRIFKRAFKVVRERKTTDYIVSDASQLSESGKTRVALFHKLNMM